MQKTQDCSPYAHVFCYKNNDNAKEKICLKEFSKKEFFQQVNVSPDLTNKISHTDHENNNHNTNSNVNTDFKLDLISNKIIYLLYNHTY